MRYDAAVIGMGRVGLAAAYDLKRMGYKVIGLDISSSALEKASSRIGIDVYEIDPGFKWMDTFNLDVDIYLMALPLEHTLDYLKRLLNRGCRVVDATSVPEERLGEVESWIREGGVAFLYAGLAPGMAQTLAGALYREMDKPERIDIYVGGLPQNPDESPLLTGITFHSEAFFRQYNRPSRKVVDWEVVTLDPFEDIGRINLPGDVELEYFLTDGLKSLLKTLKIKYLAEYTLRIPGHISRMKLLRDLGYLDWEDIKVDGCRVKPIKFTAQLLGERLSDIDRDWVALAVYGYRDGVRTILYSYIHYNEDLGFTAMQMATGFNLARFSKLVLDNNLDGLMLPEYIGMDEDLYKAYIELIGEAGIKVSRVVEI